MTSLDTYPLHGSHLSRTEEPAGAVRQTLPSPAGWCVSPGRRRGYALPAGWEEERPSIHEEKDRRDAKVGHPGGKWRRSCEQSAGESYRGASFGSLLNSSYRATGTAIGDVEFGRVAPGQRDDRRPITIRYTRLRPLINRVGGQRLPMALQLRLDDRWSAGSLYEGLDGQIIIHAVPILDYKSNFKGTEILTGIFFRIYHA